MNALQTIHMRRYSPAKQFRLLSIFSNKQKYPEWGKAMSAAEKVVGYPTSFMNLRFWLSDEMSNVAVNMRKLIGTRHPLMQTAKGLIFGNGDNVQTRGLLVLLMSKAAGLPDNPIKFERHHLDIDKNNTSPDSDTNGILSTQRSLAEITEMIHTATVLHNGVMDLDSGTPPSAELDDLLYGNKMAILSGDYLLAKASSGLAALENTHVVGIMASAIADLMEGACFMQDLEETNSRVERLSLNQWELLAYRSGGCLFAKSCQSALMLAHHEKKSSDRAFEFGKNFGYLRRIKSDLEPQENVSIESILNTLKATSESSKIHDLQEHYKENALASLEFLSNSDAKNALVNVLQALTNK